MINRGGLKPKKTLESVLSGRQDQNLRFEDRCGLLEALRFERRVRGSHRIFTQAGVAEIINIQPRAGGRAKPYQVKQVRNLITHYGLGLDP